MLATIAPLPPPPHLLVEDMDVKKLAAAYAVLALIADPKAHKTRLQELTDKMAAMVEKSTELQATYDNLVRLKGSLDQAIKNHTAAVSEHADKAASQDREHSQRMDALNVRALDLDHKEAALNNRDFQLKDAGLRLQQRAEAITAMDADLIAKHKTADDRLKDLDAREATLKDAEAAYRTRVAKLREFVG